MSAGSTITTQPTEDSTGMGEESGETTIDPEDESSGGEPDACGDGVLAESEECDDANDVDADGCDADCTTTRVIQIGVGHLHTCALLDSGDLRCWGANAYGAVGSGNGDTIGDDEPASAADLVDVGGKVTQLAVGAAHTCARRSGRGLRRRCRQRRQRGRVGRQRVELGCRDHGTARDLRRGVERW